MAVCFGMKRAKQHHFTPYPFPVPFKPNPTVSHFKNGWRLTHCSKLDANFLFNHFVGTCTYGRKYSPPDHFFFFSKLCVRVLVCDSFLFSWIARCWRKKNERKKKMYMRNYRKILHHSHALRHSSHFPLEFIQCVVYVCGIEGGNVWVCVCVSMSFIIPLVAFFALFAPRIC